MRLKKLKISGFKSFADKVVIDFDSSIIAIVGPNGCGKSNIVDAFRWVMGEQSAKSMRGDKMHDVLFGGTEKRKPLNIAEVSVSLSDVEDILPVPYDEITITRRLHRSGESEYLLNKEQVRLKDIQDLLLGSGLGKNAFSIFEQGKLDQIIHLNPNDRRAIFDDAAGIGRFLQRKKETIRKLEHVADNYNRLRDIHVEVEKQARTLKRQAVQAETYHANKSRLESLEKNVLLYKWQRSAKKGEGFDEKLQEILKEIKEKNLDQAYFEEKLRKIKNSFSEREKVAKEEKEKLYQFQSAYKILLAEIERYKQNLEELNCREQSILNEIDERGKKRKSALTAAKEKEEHLSKIGAEKNALEKEVSIKKQAKQSSDGVLLKLREQLKEAQKSHFDQVQKQNQVEKQLHQKQLQFESRKERLSSLKSQLGEKKENLKNLGKEISSKEKGVSELIDQIDRLKNEVSGFESKLSLCKKEREEKQKEFDLFLQDLAELQARETSLIRLRQEFEGFSSGAKELLKESKNSNSPIFEKLQPLFEYLSPHPGYEKELAISLHPYTHTLVVKNQSDLQLVIDYAHEKKLQDFSLISLDKIHSKAKKGAANFLSHVDANSLATHLLYNIEISENLQQLIKYDDKEYITRDGFFLDHKQVLFHVPSGQGEKNTFLREAELKEIEKKIQKLRKKRNDTEALIQKLEEDRGVNQQKRNEIEEKRRRKEMDLVQENFILQRALSDLEKVKAEILKIEKEKAGLDTTGKLEEEAIEQLTISLKDMEGQVSNLLNQAQESEKKLVELEHNFKSASDAWQNAQRQFHQVESNWSMLNQELKIIEARDQEGQKQQSRLLKDLDEVKNAVQKISLCLSEKEQQSIEMRFEVEKLNESSSNFEMALEGEKEALEKIEESLSKLRQTIADLEDKRHRIEVSQAEDSSVQREVESELYERYNLKSDDLKNLDIHLDTNLSESENEIRQLRRSLESAGAVNLMAIEEYQEYEKRHQELEKQLNDLDESKGELEQIISQLDSESRKLFKETFSQIRSNFLKNFTILFNGGEADLKFTESLDVLEAGVEIVAKPPGKQMRSISLLSGGEKCLTALALLFSIFEVRPAPFCILDEVDAPLDDTNIDRFTNVLKQFIDKTQFIIVSHNKKTMSIADPLIGVSMEEKGVSKLISLSFEKKQMITA